MTTFLIMNDGYKFQEFDLEIDDIVDFVPEKFDLLDIYDFSLHNLAFAKWWGKVESGFTAIDSDSSAEIPDISCWIGATLILSNKAYNLLKSELKPYGEFLPVQCASNNFYIFNCLTIVNVDEQKSEQELFDGEVVDINKIVFDKSEVGTQIIYKTKYNNCQDLFCNESFKEIIIKNYLTGITFSENLTQSGH